MPAVSERDRHDLFVAVQDRFGERHADTLMNLLPPVGWADVATKDDIHQLGARLDGEFHHLRKEIVELEHRIGLRFDTVDARFEPIDRTTKERFGAVDRTMNERFDAVDQRFEHADAVAAERFESFAHQIKGEMHQMKGDTHQAMVRHLHALVFGFVAAFTSMTSLGIAAIALA